MSVPRRAARVSTPPVETEKVRRELLDGLIGSYARRAELLLIGARVLVAVASLTNGLLVWRHGGGAMAEHFSLIAALHLVSVAGYLTLWLAVRRARRLVPLLAASVVLDAAVLFGFLLPGVLWPGPDHAGILHALGVALVPLATVAAGCRFHLRIAFLGIGVELAGVLALVAIDLVRNQPLVRYDAGQLIGVAILLGAGASLALLVAHLTRRMVYEAAGVAMKVRLARDKFRAYVTERVAREVLDSSSEEISLDGEQRHVAVLFCDLRGFTAYAAAVEPRELVAELNAYFDSVVPPVQEQGGTVDKFMGDAIMAVFTREEGGPDPAQAALAAAAAMRRALERHNAERARWGKPPLEHGIGIHVGFAVAGNVGTAERLQYTVIGDVVNVASRLEKATKELGTWLVCSRAAWDEAASAAGPPPDLPPMEPVAPLGLRGLDGPLAAMAPAARARGIMAPGG